MPPVKDRPGILVSHYVFRGMEIGRVGSYVVSKEGDPRRRGSFSLVADAHARRVGPGLSAHQTERARVRLVQPVRQAYYRNRFPNPYTGSAGDATFPNYIVLASYGYRFGKKSAPISDTAICPQ